MGARSYIVRGKGQPAELRVVLARRRSDDEPQRGQAPLHARRPPAATAGVECRKDAGVIDETPAAYKDIDAVMAAQSDLVEIVHTLKQVVCVKG
jgi:tRNA-splicing ligase RtcB